MKIIVGLGGYSCNQCGVRPEVPSKFVVFEGESNTFICMKCMALAMEKLRASYGLECVK